VIEEYIKKPKTGKDSRELVDDPPAFGLSERGGKVFGASLALRRPCRGGAKRLCFSEGLWPEFGLCAVEPAGRMGDEKSY